MSTPVGSVAKAWKKADAALTRPNNATPYAANQGIGSGATCLFKFSNFFPLEGGNTGLLTGMRLTATVASIAASNMGSITAHLYNTSPTSPPSSDQQSYTSLSSNQDVKLGMVSFFTWNIGGSGSTLIDSYGAPILTPLPIQAAANSADLYLFLVATAAFTPIASAIITPYLSAVFD